MDGGGLPGYGSFFVTLKEDKIAERSTVFEENPFTFIERHRILTTKPIPPGYRATWSNRSKLAVAKLHHLLQSTTTDADFSSILLNPGTNSDDYDCIEVHTFGPLHRSAIERVVGSAPADHSERAIWKSVRKKLEALGAIVDVSE